MERQFLLLLIFFNLINNSNLAQDTTVSVHNYDIVQKYLLDDKTLIKNILSQNQIEYWEYRIGNNDVVNDCPWDSIGCINYIHRCTHYVAYNGGTKWVKDDSLKIKDLNECSGLEISPKIDAFYYLVLKVNDKNLVINSYDNLIQIIKPINTLEKALFYALLNGFVTQDISKKVYFKKGDSFFELIMVSNICDKFVQKRNGGVFYHSVYYIKMNDKGYLYKKKVGVKKYRIKKFVV